MADNNNKRNGNDIATMTISGRLANDAEIRQRKDGKGTFATYSIANQPYGKQNASFFDCVQSGNLEWLKKGMPVTVTGVPDIQEYTDKSGNKQRRFRLNVRELAAFGNKNNASAAPAQAASTAPEIGEEIDEDDDLPF